VGNSGFRLAHDVHGVLAHQAIADRRADRRERAPRRASLRAAADTAYRIWRAMRLRDTFAHGAARKLAYILTAAAFAALGRFGGWW
jgi:hypothetical protein